MRGRRFGFSLAACLAVACALALVLPAAGFAVATRTTEWGTGQTEGNYNGTHGWIMYNGALLASNHGVKWINYGLAVERSAWPDTHFNDHIDHNYNWWGSYPSYYDSSWPLHFGNPEGKVQKYYNAAVAALRAGDTDAASINIGYMSHYFADIHQPLHTQESAKETSALHTSYENHVDGMLSSYDSHRSWIKDDGYQYIANPSKFTVSEATWAHGYYSDLVNNYYSDGFNSTVEDITSSCLNRAVNGLSDLIVSAQWDADSVSAAIDNVSPAASTTGTPVTFVGHGHDPLRSVNAWQWRSSADGVLSGAPSFTSSSLTLGIHWIYFKARSSLGKWSTEVGTPIVVGAQNTKPLAMYRFLNRKTNVHFYTASVPEMKNVVAKLSNTYTLEGIAFAIDTSATANNSPLFRFYNRKQGTHFYTADTAERDHILNTMGNVYQYDGVITNISLSPVGTQPVYRFYNFRKNVHFYTASLAERDSIVAHLGYIYHYEGVAYYFAPPW